jgi:hypothetical protein
MARHGVVVGGKYVTCPTGQHMKNEKKLHVWIHRLWHNGYSSCKIKARQKLRRSRCSLLESGIYSNKATPWQILKTFFQFLKVENCLSETMVGFYRLDPSLRQCTTLFYQPSEWPCGKHHHSCPRIVTKLPPLTTKVGCWCTYIWQRTCWFDTNSMQTS